MPKDKTAYLYSQLKRHRQYKIIWIYLNKVILKGPVFGSHRPLSYKMDGWDSSPTTVPSAFRLDRIRKRDGIKTFPVTLLPTPFWFIIIIYISSSIVMCQEEKREIIYEFFEEEVIGKVIGNVKEDSAIVETLKLKDPTAINRLRFQFLSNPKINLAIDEVTGILRVSGRIDRDSVCPSKPQCRLKLDIATKPLDLFKIIKVNIDLLDKNDNSPEFNQPEMKHKILESSMPGTTLILPVAKDLDSPEYGIKRYKLLSIDDANTFELVIGTKIDGSTELKLKLNSRLNREERDHYQLRLTAFDGGSTSRTGTMDVFVEVEDTNDNPPIFQNSTYYVYAPETTSVGSSLIKVQAVDRDLGLNGQVEYSFSSYTADAFGNMFGIDAISGVIKLKKHLDHEKVQLYTLTVTARDKGPNSIPSETTVVVNVLDENDHSPDITVNTLKGSGINTASVVEHSDAGTFVAHISVEDLDSGNNGRVNCSLTNNHFKLLRLYPSEYKIITNMPLDRELKEQYTLSVVCKDSGAKPQTSVQRIKVTIDDINDNSPIFSRTSYTASMMENNYEGYSVLQVNASDADTGNNAMISYSIPVDVLSFLSINSTTGRITAKSKLDREQMEKVQFYVTARDHGNPVRTGTCLVTINIDDVNDEPPVFSETGYTVGIKENLKDGYLVCTLKAHDPDEKPNNQFTFALTASNDKYLENFEIDENTGEIRTKNVLDREAMPVYMLTAVVTDKQNPKLRSIASVNIYIGDTNDNKPEWKFPTKNNNTINISNRAPNGYNIARIKAVDADTGNNQVVSYHIRSGNEEGQFRLEPNGLLSVNKALDYINFHAFELELIAKDQGNPSNSALSQLIVNVNKSIPFPLQQTSSNHLLAGTNFTIVVSLTCACVLLSVILITVIVFIRRKERKKRIHKYNCRMEALKMLTAKDPSNMRGGGMDSQDRSPIQAPPHICYNERYSDCNDSLKKDMHSCGSLNNAHSSSSTLNNTWSGSEKHKVKFASPPERYVKPPTSGRSLEKREVEVHRFLDSLGDGDRDSIHSGDGSNTDSGRGPSEEGEAAARHLADAQKGVGTRHHGQYPRQHCSTMPIHSRPPVHLNHQPPARFQTFSPPVRINQNGDTETTYVPNNNKINHSHSHNPQSAAVKQVTFMNQHNHRHHPNDNEETTYVPNSTHSTPTQGKLRANTETTFTTQNGDTVETTYVPHTISTLSNCRLKYFPVNSNVKDTTL